jgi:hypothetical protein
MVMVFSWPSSLAERWRNSSPDDEMRPSRVSSLAHATQTHDQEDFCVVFLHLPKTGGTTLATSLRWSYPPERTIHADVFGKVDEIERLFTIDSRANARLLYGHLPYGVHRYIPRTCRYITILREPVARVVSAYKYILANDRHSLHDRVIEHDIGLEEYVENFWVDRQTSRQTRQLCDRPNGPLDGDALDQARRNLSEFLVVGLTERFEESFVLCRRTLSLRRPFYVTRNVSQPIRLSRRAIDLIRQREEYDIALYAHARKLFAEQIMQYGISFGIEATMYRAARPLFRLAGERLGGR